MTINPVFLSLGSLQIRWYGVMAALGMLSAYFLCQKRRKKYDFQANDVSDIIFNTVIGVIIGARALYVFRFWEEEFSGHWLDILKIYQGGLVFYGGFAGAVLAVALLSYRRKWALWRTADLLAPALLLGQFFGRIGCLLNGCCHGFDYNGPLAFCYPPLHPGPTFPLQGCSALAALLGCAILLWLEHKGFFRKRLLCCCLVLYCVGRFCLEFGRGDYPAHQLAWGVLTPAQVTCLWLLPATLLVYLLAAFLPRKK